MLQATSPRHNNTQAPIKARTAPTAMKMVPSGMVDFCMKGAAAVYGITRVGTPAPAMVGRPVSEKSAPLVVDVVASGKVAVSVADVPDAVLSSASLVDEAESVSLVVVWSSSPVEVAVVRPVVSSDVAVVSASEVDVTPVTVARSGKSACACTRGTASSAKSAIARIIRGMTDSKCGV